MGNHLKASLCALIWVGTSQAVTIPSQDRGERYQPTPIPCLAPTLHTFASPNGDGRSGGAPALVAASADNSAPSNNGFAPPARIDMHGQQLAGPPGPPHPRAEPSQCAKSCDAGYTPVTDEQRQLWCQRIKPKAIRLSVPLGLKPAGIEKVFPFARNGKNHHVLDPGSLSPWQGRVVVEVIGDDDKPLANQAIKLVQTVEEGSGHHPAHLHEGTRPLAKLFLGKKAIAVTEHGEVTTSLVTNAEGQISLFFSAPEFAGIHRLTAKCVPKDCSTYVARVEVKVPDLEPFEPAEGTAILVGGDKEKHDERHHLTLAAIRNLETLINAMNKFGWKLVEVNDAALPWGGLFDITGKWKPSHFDHGAGTAVDINSKRIKLAVKAKTFKSQCNASHDPDALSNQLPTTKILWHSGKPKDPEHFHVYLEGTAPNGTTKICNDAGRWIELAEKEAKKNAPKNQ